MLIISLHTLRTSTSFVEAPRAGQDIGVPRPDLVSVGAKLSRLRKMKIREHSSQVPSTPNNTDFSHNQLCYSSKGFGFIFSTQFKRFANAGVFKEQTSVQPHLHPRLNFLVAMATMDYEQENGRYDSM